MKKPASWLLLAVLLLFFPACQPQLARVDRQEYYLGTVCSVSAWGASGQVLDEVFAAVADIDRRMRISGESSELARVNKAAGLDWVPVSEDTYQLIQRSVEYAALVPGTFDISVYPLIRLWGIGIVSEPSVPDAQKKAEILPLIDATRIGLRHNSVFLPSPGMGIDLGGIAKGYAADTAREILKNQGIRHALIDFGGDIHTLGPRPDGSPWRIGIQDPAGQRGAFIGIIRVVDKTVVTSGPYERYFMQDGTRYHHIFDPRTGYPAESGIVSVTIVAEDSARADAFSTMVFITGIQAGLELVEAQSGIDAVIIGEALDIHLSSGIGDSFELRDNSYTLVRK